MPSVYESTYEYNVPGTEDENKSKYDMHDGYDKIHTWLDLLVNKKIILQNVGSIGKAAAVSCKRSFEGRAAILWQQLCTYNQRVRNCR